MNVRLLKDIYEGRTYNAQGQIANAGALKTLRKGARYGTGPDGQLVIIRPETVIEFRQGVEIEMSDASGQKYIDAGDAEKA